MNDYSVCVSSAVCTPSLKTCRPLCTDCVGPSVNFMVNAVTVLILNQTCYRTLLSYRRFSLHLAVIKKNFQLIQRFLTFQVLCHYYATEDPLHVQALVYIIAIASGMKPLHKFVNNLVKLVNSSAHE